MCYAEDSFDAITHVTSNIKKAARLMLGQGTASATSDLAQRGIRLCADIVPASNELEAIMFKQKDELELSTVLDAVHNVEAPYMELLKYYNDVVKIMRTTADGNNKKGLPKLIKGVQ